MRQRVSTLLWGIGFIVAGIGFAGDTLHLWDFDLFFDGWWTVFIILPCLASMIQSGVHIPQLIGLSVGVILLLSEQDILPDGLIWKLVVPVVLLAIGIKLIFGFRRGFRPVKVLETTQRGYASFVAVMGAREARCIDTFEGGEITAVLGGVDLDLRQAVIEKDITLDITAIMGGVDLRLPPNVRVSVNATPILGGVEDCTEAPPTEADAPNVSIHALCICGGVEIK